jgi:hypothetical protein
MLTRCHGFPSWRHDFAPTVAALLQVIPALRLSNDLILQRLPDALDRIAATCGILS